MRKRAILIFVTFALFVPFIINGIYLYIEWRDSSFITNFYQANLSPHRLTYRPYEMECINEIDLKKELLGMLSINTEIEKEMQDGSKISDEFRKLLDIRSERYWRWQYTGDSLKKLIADGYKYYYELAGYVYHENELQEKSTNWKIVVMRGLYSRKKYDSFNSLFSAVKEEFAQVGIQYKNNQEESRYFFPKIFCDVQGMGNTCETSLFPNEGFQDIKFVGIGSCGTSEYVVLWKKYFQHSGLLAVLGAVMVFISCHVIGLSKKNYKMF